MSYDQKMVEPVLMSDGNSAKYVSYVHTTNSPGSRVTSKHPLEASPENGKLSDWVLERLQKVKN